MKPAIAALALAILAGCAAGPTTPEVRGTRPTYLTAITPAVPNGAALQDHIFTPGLDEGWVPQGLAHAEGHLLVSSYLPTPDLKANTGPCRVFRIDPRSGRGAGHFDLPVGVCTHAGGMGYLGHGRLFLADTRQVFLIDLPKALASGKAEGAMKGVKITGLLRGSYAASDGKDFWIGTWTRDKPEVARMFRLDPQLFDKYEGQTVREDRALESIPVPLEAQGAAFDKAGNLWVSSSGPKSGRLYRLDRKGAIQAEYAMVPGLEDLTVDDSGALWGLSESGTRKYMHWETHYPYIFRIDTAKLK